MGISGQMGVVSHRIIDQRYALMNSLSVSGAGELYQGRDVDLMEKEGMHSRVLVHVIPESVMAGVDVGDAFQKVQHSLSFMRAGEQVLPVIAYGRCVGAVYFVLESPAERNVQALSSGESGNQKLRKKITGLYDALNFSSDWALEPGLLLTTSDAKLYVAGTALLPGLIKAVDAVATAEPLPVHQHSVTGRQLGFAGLLSLGVVAAAASTAALYGHFSGARGVSTTTHETPVPRALSVVSTPVVKLNDVPVSVQAALEPGLGDKPKAPPLVEIRSSKAQKQAPKDTDKNKLREPVKPETVSAKPVKTPLAAPVEKPVAATEQPVEMGIDQLIQAAYAELARGDLPGTLRLARQLDQLYRLHPQVRRLAREVASRYHQSARALLVAGNLEKAGNELDLAKQVIQEFNLIEMNPAHELLRRKL